uniref:Methyltransferase type 11 domain-containing protein n=1 Tax=Lactuca sativa TaxID=4236 RepID=A0A9R1XJ71_LACSA|nr:hypothetical protein LSAT_V11C300127010 [Lactuca sativa]
MTTNRINSNFDSDKLYPPVGSLCTLSHELKNYMTYPVKASFPDDELLAQKLLLKGCEPLPRRCCRPPSPPNYTEPYPIPKSFWSTPPNSSGREKTRWVIKGKTKTDFAIEGVLVMKRHGMIRIGLDIGGGVGTFAVRMMERNITIITTSMNLNGPFNSFIASRGVVPMYISVSERLPFFDSTLDIVHSMHVLSNLIPTTLLHFLFFDIYWVLRPGGVFWLDHFFCVGEELEGVYVPLLESVGFNKVKWVVGKKMDRGLELNQRKYTVLSINICQGMNLNLAQ